MINIREMKVRCFISGRLFIVFILAIRDKGPSHMLRVIRGEARGSVAKLAEILCHNEDMCFWARLRVSLEMMSEQIMVEGHRSVRGTAQDRIRLDEEAKIRYIISLLFSSVETSLGPLEG